jgi:hypothetical protein
MQKRVLIVSVVAILLGFSGFAFALPVSTLDLWDISRGTVVTSSSPMYYGGTSGASNMFGGTGSSPEAERALFTDAYSAGYVHWVEWQTVAPVTIGSFNLVAAHDGSPRDANYRGFSRLSLYYWSGSIWNKLTTDYYPSNPYGGGPDYPVTNFLELYRLVDPVTAQNFRAEFVQYGNAAGAKGPRIVELDAFAPVPEPATISLLGIGLLGIFGLRRRKI